MSLSVVASLFLALRVPLGAPAPRASRAAVSMQLGNPLDLLSEAGEKAAKAAAEAAETATKAATGAMGSQAGDLFRKMTGSDESLGGLSKEEAEEMEGRMRAGAMSFDDFLKQVQVMQKMGSLQSMMSKVPGMGGNKLSDEQLKDGERKLKRYAKYVESMEADERANPQLLIEEAMKLRPGGGGGATARMSAIADKSGASLEDVARFVNEFSSLSKAAQGFARGEDPETLRQRMQEEQMAAGAGPVNRAQRRQMKRKGKGSVRSRGGGGGFS